ncbi:AraC family transcriptional regulator [Sphingopyxis sp. JAI108]|uniref:AraC family transcriptional regulator n=1 Tax=Sphingopyxis sp. JAI108 TaxID=2723060 RepID=UPI0015C93080|nr:AraC family transcriptional regulator [Sphingopyxis sp. JAI108]NYF30620.1 AraC-like DNA-binding protein [Sphingopyxis sp. JAI108]
MTDPLTQIVGLLRPDLSFAKLTEASGPWRIRRSEQGTPFFCAVLDGAVQLEIKGRAPLRISGGDFLLIPAAFDFTFTSLDPAPARGLDSVPIQMRPGVYRIGNPAAEPNLRMLVGYCTFGSTDAALLVSLLPSLIHARGNERLTTLLQLAADESRAERAGREVILARLMEILFIEALRATGPDCPSGMLRGLGDDRIAIAIRLIHDEPNAAWTVERLAKAAALSRSAFYDRFRRTVGMAPMEYLLHWRMILAKQLLGDRQTPIAEVAQRVGYGSASSFSVAFLRHVGMPPGLYARHQRAA